MVPRERISASSPSLLNARQSGFCVPDRLGDSHFQWSSTASPPGSDCRARKLYQAELAGYKGARLVSYRGSAGRFDK